jgi:hypothetical protein
MGCSKSSNTINPPIAPTGLAIVKTNGSQANYYQLDLSWKDNSSDETAFVIEEKSEINGTSLLGYNEVITLNANTTSTSLVFQILKSEKAYFRVYAMSKAGGKSAYSNEFLVTQ